MNAPNKLELLDSEHQLTATKVSLPAGWDGTSTDFAITTINVPDRLDVLEVRAREEEQDRKADERSMRIDWDKWLKRTIAAVAVLAAVVATYRFAWEPIDRDLSPSSVAAHLSKSFGQNVKVASTNFDLLPNPRLVVTGVDNAGRWRLSEVSLRMNWSELWNALRAGSWTWAEATVAPQVLGEAEALALYQDLTRVRVAMPVSVSTLRFTEVQLSNNRWLPGRYEIVSRRLGTGEFADPVLTELGIDGSMRLRLIRQGGGEAEANSVGYTLEASNWKAPFGPSVRWNEVTSTGTVQPKLVSIQSFVLSGFYGLSQGTVVAAKDREWVLTGTVKSSSVDLDSISRFITNGDPVAPEGTPRRSLSGSAAFELLIGGRGATLADAVDKAVVAGPVTVRFAQLNEINLGLAAARGGVGQGKGGVTRFTELSASVVGGAAGTSVRNIVGRSGTMSVRGDLRIADKALAGTLAVDIATQREMRPFTVKLSGTPTAPVFSGH